MERQNLRLAESLSFRENKALSAYKQLRVIRRTQEERTNVPILPSPTDLDDDMEHMALSEVAKKWFKQHGLEGFLRIVEAPPHGEAEKVV